MKAPSSLPVKKAVSTRKKPSLLTPIGLEKRGFTGLKQISRSIYESTKTKKIFAFLNHVDGEWYGLSKSTYQQMSDLIEKRGVAYGSFLFLLSPKKEEVAISYDQLKSWISDRALALSKTGVYHLHVRSGKIRVTTYVQPK